MRAFLKQRLERGNFFSINSLFESIDIGHMRLVTRLILLLAAQARQVHRWSLLFRLYSVNEVTAEAAAIQRQILQLLVLQCLARGLIVFLDDGHLE